MDTSLKGVITGLALFRIMSILLVWISVGGVVPSGRFRKLFQTALDFGFGRIWRDSHVAESAAVGHNENSQV